MMQSSLKNGSRDFLIGIFRKYNENGPFCIGEPLPFLFLAKKELYKKELYNLTTAGQGFGKIQWRN